MTVPRRRLPRRRSRYRRRGRPVGWWGVLCMIVTEAMLFVGLLSSYFFLWASSHEWPQGGIEAPELGRISIFTVDPACRAASRSSSRSGRTTEVAIDARARCAVRRVPDGRGVPRQPSTSSTATSTFGWRDNVYAAIFCMITGLHGLHVILGLLHESRRRRRKDGRGRLAKRDDISVQVFSLYWHFVDGVWIFVFALLYLAPHFR